MNIRITPNMPQHLFVGAMDGPSTCSPEDETYEVWPKFMVMVLLLGRQHFVMDGTDFHLDAGDLDDPKPTVFMLNIAKGCQLRFVNETSTPLRKVMISAPQPWVERLVHSQPTSMPRLRDFFCAHLAEFRFSPNMHLVEIAERIINPPAPMAGELLTLYKNTHAFDILCQACATLVTEGESRAQPAAFNRQQSERIRDYVLAHLHEDLSLSDIARAIGTSTSSVQRHFKDFFNMTVSDFIRNERLEIARDALERQGIPISQAAYLAGYNNPSSFTTAFKRRYGQSPKYYRA